VEDTGPVGQDLLRDHEPAPPPLPDLLHAADGCLHRLDGAVGQIIDGAEMSAIHEAAREAVEQVGHGVDWSGHLDSPLSATEVRSSARSATPQHTNRSSEDPG